MAILGMRGSGVFVADERPQNWRQGILLLFPNGDAPLTAILSKLSEEPTDDPQFNWFEKGLPIQRGIILGASTTTTTQPADNADIAAADATAEIAISVMPDGGAQDDVTWIKPGHLIMNLTTEEVMIVVSKGTTVGPYLRVQRDVGNKFASNPAVTGDTAAGDPILIVGSGFPEGAPVGDAISYQSIRHLNYTQIMRTPLKLTRTARKTKLRYDRNGAYREAQREALQLHSLELEKAVMFSERSEITAITTAATELSGISAGQPLRTTRGIYNWLPAISTSLATPAVHWDIGTANGGTMTEDIFDNWLAEIFRFGSSEKLAFLGSTALNVLNKIAKNKLTIQAVPEDRTYGMAFQRYITPFGVLMVKNHPLMSNDAVLRKDILVVDTAHIKLRPLDDTTFLRNRQSPGDDASVDEYLTEAGLEVRFSGATPSTAGGLPAAAGPAVHGRLKGVNAAA